ncbi:flagellar hook capping FlgD N-terminal domain-containing protein [Paracoccus sp. 1_MG-2023]|uniref:flagellar hook capping FlgD N-terminal domain-containing protein n=1 Tax=unclassified Paracoccus (in: a-proteobacteria) TaxID=2688777 RepID=UPI001C08798E|nr:MULTISPECIES: flagellar hook capping FlgD N-terminal domain-containing protein [unclassified Paracoccus (in: a-proteobacteria)]MBU2956180.1 flagellar basal body rod modification protein [Paracoccus sp. C2R09]MDO6667857.1 flagellar hook capping FlgD N-terminal domain-containing protein [Paracoccus sp. 1_MG-2023]
MVDAITATTTSTISASSFTSSGTGGDFETFLKMLTAQLQNQDPLNPMESTDFAVQLATFAGVEQQALSNQLLEQLVGQSGTGGIGGVADWIGKEARTTGPVHFGDTPLTLEVAPHALADSVTLITTTATGQELMREEIGPGEGQIDWYGRDDLGNKLPDGLYAFQIVSSRDGQVIDTSEVETYARVTEAQVGPDGTMIVLEGGATASVDQVTGLREAPDA